MKLKESVKSASKDRESSLKKQIGSEKINMPINSAVLDELNSDNFIQKQFNSSMNKKMDNIVIDLQKQTIKVPEVEPVEPDSIFNSNLFMNEETRMEKWVKELYSYRQKALQQGLKN